MEKEPGVGTRWGQCECGEHGIIGCVVCRGYQL